MYIKQYLLHLLFEEVHLLLLTVHEHHMSGLHISDQLQTRKIVASDSEVPVDHHLHDAFRICVGAKRHVLDS